jgi:acyl carrier protein
MSLGTHDEIFNTLRAMMSELFEIDESRIQLDTKLYDELEIDSIDAVDLMERIKRLTGKKVSPDDFKTVRTIRDVVETIEKLVNS